MIVITNKNGNCVSIIANDTTKKPAANAQVTKTGDSNLGVWENGYPVLIEENIAYVPQDVNIFQNIEVSEEIKIQVTTYSGKYCYTEVDGFYLNPDWVEPDPANVYGISDELFNQIKSDYREQIASEVTENGYNA